MDDDLQLAAPSYNAASADTATEGYATADASVSVSESDGAIAAQAATAGNAGQAAIPEGSAQTAAAEGDAEDPAEGLVADASEGALPQQVAYLPMAKPIAAFGAAAMDSQVAEAAAPLAAAAAGASPDAPADGTGDVELGPSLTGTYLTAGEMPVEAIAPKKKTFLAAFFGASSANAAPAATRRKVAPLIQPSAAPVAAAVASKPLISSAKAEPLLTLVSAEPSPARAALGEGSALPGVRQTALFEIKRKSGIDDDSDVDLHEDEEAPMQIASAAGLARLAPNGLLRQTEGVDVACLKPSLLRMLKQVEGHYGRKAMITSGYRDPARNRRARGAKNSLHMYCAAVDVQIAGVTKWELASYVRTMPGRGGVGTYCHTESVHIDVGPERDWNWRCRRRG